MPDPAYDYHLLDTYFRHGHSLETVLVSLHASQIALLKMAEGTEGGQEALLALSDILGSFIEEMENLGNQQ